MAEKSWLNKMFTILIFLQYNVLPHSLRCFTVFQRFWKIFNILGGINIGCDNTWPLRRYSFVSLRFAKLLCWKRRILCWMVKQNLFFKLTNLCLRAKSLRMRKEEIFFPKSKLLKGGKRKCIIFSILINQFLLQKMLFACETVDKKMRTTWLCAKKSH